MFKQIFDNLKISASALSAERRRMNVIANNMANINTTRTENGEPFRRKYVVFKTLLDQESRLGERGVEVTTIEEDQRPFRKVYKPGHPDADENGYLSLPNVDMVEENVDFLSASRSYSANLSVMKSTKAMVSRMLDMIAGRR